MPFLVQSTSWPLALNRISKFILDAFPRFSTVFSILSSFFCPLSPAFVTSLSKGSQMSRANHPREITSSFILLEKGPALELFSLPSALPQASVIWPLLPEANGMTLWMWKLTYRGEVFGWRADYVLVMVFFHLQGFGWKGSTPTSAWHSSGPMLPSGPPCPW